MTKWSGPVVATIDMLLALFVVAVALISDPQPVVKVADKPVCVMAVDATWQGNINVDVDLWVQAPGDIPIGYSSKSGWTFNLVRDDLGTLTDYLGINSERACASGIPDGEYLVNLHLYNYSVPPPISVTVIISLVDPHKAEMIEFFSKSVKLEYKGHELTVVRFDMKNGKMVTGSEHTIPKKIRHGSGNAAPGVRR